MNPPASAHLQTPCDPEISALEAATLKHPVTVSLEAFSGHAITGRLIDSQVHFSSPTHIARVELIVELDLAPPHFAPRCTLPVNPDYPIRVMPLPVPLPGPCRGRPVRAQPEIVTTRTRPTRGPEHPMSDPEQNTPQLLSHWPVGGLQNKPLPYPMTRTETAVFVLAVLAMGVLPLWPMAVLGGQLFEPGLARALPGAVWLLVLAPLLLRVAYKRLGRRQVAGARWRHYNAQARAAQSTDHS